MTAKKNHLGERESITAKYLVKFFSSLPMGSFMVALAPFAEDDDAKALSAFDTCIKLCTNSNELGAKEMMSAFEGLKQVFLSLSEIEKRSIRRDLLREINEHLGGKHT